MIERVVCPILVGQEEELSALEDSLLGATRGEGSVVVLAGEAGLGKTRLARELRRRADKIGCGLFWGGGSEADLALPYPPFLEAIRNHFLEAVGNYLRTADLGALRERLGPVASGLALLFPQLHRGPVAVEVGDLVARELDGDTSRVEQSRKW